MDLSNASNKIAAQGELVSRIRDEVGKVIVGQEKLIDRLILALVANGHILLEGVPGLAKTLSVNTLAKTLGLDFKRISFTPDLLPADVVGTLIYSPKTGEFSPKKGPVFTNMLLADEINRAPAKVQSALLESMQERQVTIGETTYKCSPRRTRSSRRAPTRSPRRRWTASCSSASWRRRRSRTSAASWTVSPSRRRRPK